MWHSIYWFFSYVCLCYYVRKVKDCFPFFKNLINFFFTSFTYIPLPLSLLVNPFQNPSPPSPSPLIRCLPRDFCLASTFVTLISETFNSCVIFTYITIYIDILKQWNGTQSFAHTRQNALLLSHIPACISIMWEAESLCSPLLPLLSSISFLLSFASPPASPLLSVVRELPV